MHGISQMFGSQEMHMIHTLKTKVEGQFIQYNKVLIQTKQTHLEEMIVHHMY